MADTARSEDQGAIAAARDERVTSLTHVLYGYHEGPAPRAGCRIQIRRSQRTGVVLGTHMDGYLLVVDDDNGKTYWASADNVQPVRAAARLTLHEWLMLARKLAEAGECFAISILSAHFRGINGLPYASPEALAWCVGALLRARWFRTNAPGVDAWLRTHVASLRLPTEQLPPPGTEEEIATWAAPTSDRAAESSAVLVKSFVEQAVTLGASSLAQAAHDNDLKASYREDRSGALAVDVKTGLQVVILGPSKVVTEEGFVDALFLDNLEPASRHISGLEVSLETIDPAWLWEAVTGAARQPMPGLAVALWLAASEIGPSGLPEPSEERAKVRIIGAAIGLRAFGKHRVPLAQKWLRLARETWRSLPKADKSRMAALIPELVASTKHKVVADLGALHHEFRSATERMLERHPVPAVAPSHRSIVAPVDSDALERTIPQSPAPDRADAGRRRERRLASAPSSTRVRFAKQRQLRFDLTDHALLASEWALSARDDAYADAVTSALGWLENRMGRTLPKTWREGAHEIERLGVSLQLESGPGIFAFRLDHPDTEHPTRWWRTEATVLAGKGGRGGMVGVRLTVRDLVELLPPQRTVPAIVREWARSPGLLLAGGPSTARTWVRNRGSLEQLAALLGEGDRDAPVWVTRAPFSVTASLQGLARLMLLDPAIESEYADRYAPLPPGGLHLFGTPGEEPALLFPHAAHGLHELRHHTLAARQRSGTPSFREVRDAVAEARMHALARARAPAAETASEPSLVPVPNADEIRVLISREVRDYEELLRVAEEERDQAVAARDGFLHDLVCSEEEIQDLKRRLHAAQVQLRQADSRLLDLPVREPPPETLEHIASWAPTLSPRVVFADKAIRTAARTIHNDPALIYGALEQLADSYWLSRWAESDDARRDARETWDEYLRCNRLRWSGVGSAIHDSRYVQEYRATIGGRTYTMDMHIAGSSTHDPMRCVRIYCYADDADRKIVVGHLPTHLTSGLT